MKKLLQIDVCLNWGSTGRIAENIAKTAMKKGWECYMIHGSRYCNPPSVMNAFRPGSVLDEYWHYFEHKAFDNDGLSSDRATKRAVQFIKLIQPDLIQIHTIHDHWLNYKILFEYLVTLDIPVVWTQHDCWSFTGGCSYFERNNCYKWRGAGCTNGCCDKSFILPRCIVEKTKEHFRLKKELFGKMKNLVIVPVSHWLERYIKESFLGSNRIVTIHNGIDLSRFYASNEGDVLERYGIDSRKFKVLGVASTWDERKGISDFLKLSTMLSSDVQLIMVGVDEKTIGMLPPSVVGIKRTENIEELSVLYSTADLYCNLTYEDNYPTTNLEAMACGTPVLTYKTGGSIESVSPDTGYIVNQRDVKKVVEIIDTLKLKPKQERSNQRKKCTEMAISHFDMWDRYNEYLRLYEELLGRT